MTHTPFACRCGATEWQIERPKSGLHLICYCADCQTAARHLGTDGVMDAAGGTNILQVAPEQITFTKGAENLGVLRLSPKGLMRWHTTCCNTPVANTVQSPKIAFAGVIATNHRGDPKALGKVRAWVNTVYAKGARKPAKDQGMGRMAWTFLSRAFVQYTSGRWRNTPFFAGPDMAPVATPRVLSKEERNRARP